MGPGKKGVFGQRPPGYQAKAFYGFEKDASKHTVWKWQSYIWRKVSELLNWTDSNHAER